jgi:hypothetical protein
MSTTKIPEPYTRFFARIRTADIACPVCDYVIALVWSTPKRVWEPRSARVECMSCGWTARLGVVAWQPSSGRFSVPKDVRLTVTEAMRIRRELSVFLQRRLTPKSDRNLILRDRDEGLDLGADLDAPDQPDPRGVQLDKQRARLEHERNVKLAKERARVRDDKPPNKLHLRARNPIGEFPRCNARGVRRELKLTDNLDEVTCGKCRALDARSKRA